MNRSQLQPNVSAAVFSMGTLIMVLPFALYGLRNSGLTNSQLIFSGIGLMLVLSLSLYGFRSAVPQASWSAAYWACISGTLGLLSFTGMLAKAPKETIASLFIYMLVFQIATPAVWAVITGGLTLRKAPGFAAAILTAFLLG